MWSLAEAKTVSRPLPATRHLIRHLQKIIDELQAQNSQLQKKIKDLEQNLPPSKEQLGVAEAEETSLQDEFRHFGRRYGIMVNLFMTGKHCVPSKDTENYDPSQRFGLHQDKGDFHKLIAQIPEEFEYNHMDLKWLSFFRSHVKLSLSDEPMKSY